MAKLSTPSHPCETRYAQADGSPGNTCRAPAYRRVPATATLANGAPHPRAGKWECPRCRHTRERAARNKS